MIQNIFFGRDYTRTKNTILGSKTTAHLEAALRMVEFYKQKHPDKGSDYARLMRVYNAKMESFYPISSEMQWI